MTILDGKKIAADIRARVKAEVAALGRLPAGRHGTPGLGVVLVGTDPASHTYVRLKEKACAEVGIRFERTLIPAAAAQDDVLAAVRAYNDRADIDAVLVQLPLPDGMDENAVIAAMDPAKDVDGFHPDNLKRFLAGEPIVTPVIVNGLLQLIAATGIPLPGARAAVFANSTIFAEPLRVALEARGMHVTTSLGKNLADTAPTVAGADVVIVAVGKPAYVRAKDCKDGAVLIDVGTNWLPDGSYVGDVDAEGAEAKPGWLTPVPGGVGPVTVAALTENVVALNRARH
ncbi:bifunctional 5,10-methylenetetrahydrofolate dehydrogenase/5,10-methenyltetrahydrofolate cyclohydrolase [Patescibacteria group bacterium]|nr:MAG: bifunctional 5,10-methylenetetrahydrofolate dehydrogenase/5,10-methenyltetrahydrofolate cyclohydrolase [Patescibacteria group bacterium]